MTSITAYFAQRFRPQVFVPVIALLAAAAWWAAAAVDTVAASSLTLAWALVLMTLLVVGFRVWDDLEDVERDRAANVDRVLVVSEGRPFYILLMLLTAMTAAALARRGPVLIAFAVLCGAFLILYRSVRPRIADARWRYGVLLLKYPAFVVLVAASIGRPGATRLGATAMAAYVSACIYEAWHHDRCVGQGVVR